MTTLDEVQSIKWNTLSAPPRRLAIPPVSHNNEPLEPDHVKLLHDCTPMLGDMDALHRHMDQSGYLYLPGYLGRQRVLEARRVMMQRLSEMGALAPDTDPMDGIAHPTQKVPGFAGGNIEKTFADWRKIHDVLYDGPMIEFFRQFVAGPVRHYDYTWIRQVWPGPSTPIHSDVVYMGRGTHQLFTAWTPMGDATFEMGGLLLLQCSHNHQGLAKKYWQFDVDAYCSNTDDHRDGWQKTGGYLRGKAATIRRSLGDLNWGIADFRAGDVVIFNCYTVHGGTDNCSDRLRLSTDTRYQNAQQPIDPRWIGPEPAGHGPAGKTGMIC